MSPNYFTLNSLNYKKNILSRLISKNKITYPIVAKPINEGSSIGVNICKNFIALNKAVKLLFKNYKTLIIEKYIPGQEVQVAVIKNKAIGAIELKPKRDFYDYKAKYLKSAKYKGISFQNLIKEIIIDASINR